MQTTAQFLEAIKDKYHLHSDGRLAAKLALTRSSISRFMGGKDFLGDDTALRVAALLEIDPAYVMACAHAERAKAAESRAVWERIAGMLSGVAALLLVSVAVLPATFDNVQNYAPVVSVASAENSSSIIYIMRISEFAALILFVIMAAYYLTVSHHVKLPHPRAARSVR